MKATVLRVWCATMACLFAAHAFAQSDKNDALKKDAMLRSLVSQVIVPGYTGLDATCRALTNAVEQLLSKQDASSLAHAREAWRNAAQAAGRMRCFQKGPIADRDSVST